MDMSGYFPNSASINQILHSKIQLKLPSPDNISKNSETNEVSEESYLNKKESTEYSKCEKEIWIEKKGDKKKLKRKGGSITEWLKTSSEKYTQISMRNSNGTKTVSHASLKPIGTEIANKYREHFENNNVNNN